MGIQWILTAGQRDRLRSVSECRQTKKGTVLHNGDMDCLGLLLICAGQLRGHMLSPDGREITAWEVVTRMLCYFHRAGLVQLTRGAVAITDPKRLKALSDD